MTSLFTLPNFGAASFGAVIGWLIYYINRYRKTDVQFSDLTTVIGIVGGAGITALFGGTGTDAAAQAAKQDMFGAYGIGLFVGFFAYFVALVVMVRNSGGVFDVTWFLDGRRKDVPAGSSVQTDAPPHRAFGLQPGDRH